MTAQSRKNSIRSQHFSSRTKLHIIMLVVGAIGAIAMGLSMYFSPAESQALASRHSQGVVSNVLSMFTVPILLTFIIMFAYSATELVKRYRQLQDPEYYRSRRRQSHS